MFRKVITLVFVFVMVSPVFIMSTGVTNVETYSPNSEMIVTETDLGRVTIQSNLFPNNQLEEWTDTHIPTDLLSTRSTLMDSWYEHSIVYEGSSSFGMQAQAMDPIHYSETYLTNQSQVYWHGATNLTLDVEWYMNNIGNPINTDYFRVEFHIDSRYVYYYLGCETTAVNSSSYAYFNIDGPLQIWNHLSRNISSDYFEVFGVAPDYYQTMYWRLRSYTNAMTEVYIDNMYLVNGTLVKVGGSISAGNFEGGGAWTTPSGQGAGDIVQCSDSHSGSSSMNLTAFTYDDTAYAYAYTQPEKLLTIENQANLSFWWKLENYSNPSNYMWARVAVSLENATWQSTIYYYMFVGGTGQLPLVLFGNDMKYAVDGFNVTGSWNFFDRNIWEDFNSVYPTENLWVDQISFQVRNWEDNARVSLLVDDISFNPSILSDMDYEHQNAVGQPIQGWDSPDYPIDATVTEFAKSGTKAMNLTLADSDESYWAEQKIGNLPIDETTDLFLDFNVYIDTFNASSEDYIFFNLNFEDSYIVYVIANATSGFEGEIGGEGDAKFILLQEPVVTGEWMNFRLDIVHDYEQLYGSLSYDNLHSFDLVAMGGLSSQLSVIFDDLYIYYDAIDNTAPTISLLPSDGATVSNIVSIEWNVTDTGSGVAWSQLIIEGTVITNTTIETVGVSWDTTFLYNGEYNITILAQDNAGNTASITHFVTVENAGESQAPNFLLIEILIAVAIITVAIVFILYVFVIKKR